MNTQLWIPFNIYLKITFLKIFSITSFPLRTGGLTHLKLGNVTEYSKFRKLFANSSLQIRFFYESDNVSGEITRWVLIKFNARAVTNKNSG